MSRRVPTAMSKTYRLSMRHDFIIKTDNIEEVLKNYEFPDFSQVLDDEARIIVQERETLSEIAEEFQEQFESYIQQVADRERELGHEAGALLISQMLIGWGDDAFRAIARHYMESVA